MRAGGGESTAGIAPIYSTTAPMTSASGPTPALTLTASARRRASHTRSGSTEPSGARVASASAWPAIWTRSSAQRSRLHRARVDQDDPDLSALALERQEAVVLARERG